MKEIDELHEEITEAQTDQLRMVFEDQAIQELSEEEQTRLNKVLKELDRKVDRGEIEVTEEEFERLDYELPATSRQDIIDYLEAYYEVTQYRELQNVIRSLKDGER